MNDDVASTKGLQVYKVFPGSPGEKAGMKVGDRILSIDGVAVNTTEEYLEAERIATTQMKVCILRANAIQDITVIF